MTESVDPADEAHDLMADAIDGRGFAAADVLYAIGRLIADAIHFNALDKNPDATFKLLRGVVDVELAAIEAIETTLESQDID